MSAYPSLPLFTDAFIADTGHLSAQETGAYLMLMMVAWRTSECRLPDDDDKLARWARVDRRTWLRIKPTLMEFWTLADGFWTQKRLTKEREFVSKRAEVNRRNGEQGGRPKSLKNNDASNPAGSSRVSETKAPNPTPTVQTEASPLSETHASEGFPPNAFDRFWAEYPNKVGKDAARRAFDTIRRSDRATLAEMLDGLARYRATKPPTREWCNPATWLNQGRWADQPAPAAEPRASPPYGMRLSGPTAAALARRQEAPDVPTLDLEPVVRPFPDRRRAEASKPAAGSREPDGGDRQGPFAERRPWPIRDPGRDRAYG